MPGQPGHPVNPKASMGIQLKNHESPRTQGRNIKGRGGSARKRQLDKRQRLTARNLKEGG
jgi:hypothetical protein